MNLEELKVTVDKTIEHLYYGKPDDIQVLITLAESSIGSRAFSKVKSANLGFDWEKGQFRIEPENRLANLGNTFKDIKPLNVRKYDGRNYYSCQRCNQKCAKNDNFCRSCGQRLN